MSNELKKKSILLQLIINTLPKAHFLKLMLWIISAIFLTFIAFHILCVLKEKQDLVDYSENVASRATQISFQLVNGLALASKNHYEPCSPQDLHGLRSLLSHYHYLEDIGRITKNKILCTAIWGKLVKPKPLPTPNLHSHSKKIEQYWDLQENLFVAGEDRSIYSLANAIAIISPSAFLDINQNSLKYGAIIYNYNKDFIYEKLDDIDEEKIKDAFIKENGITDWLPIPGKSINIRKCIKEYNFCTVSIDARLGIFELPFYFILFLFFVGTGLGYFGFWCAEYITKTKHSLKHRLKIAIKNDLIYPLYQPKIDLKSRKVIGIEALARWDDNEFGSVSPDTFITLAEKTGRIKEVTRNLTKKILEETKELLKERENFTVSINLSVQDLEGDNFLNFVENEMFFYQIPRHKIIFEITERSATESEIMTSASKNFSRYGYRISLDDFGTGFSNLAWLSQLEPDEIKIDKMFVQSINTESVGKITFNSICQLLKNYNVNTVFEGIETIAEMQYIMTKSPNAIGQGWLFSKALPIAEIVKLLAQDQTFADK